MASAKSGAPVVPAMTLNDTVWLRVGPALTDPLIVTWEVPMGVVALALIVRVTMAGLPETGEALDG